LKQTAALKHRWRESRLFSFRNLIYPKAGIAGFTSFRKQSIAALSQARSAWDASCFESSEAMKAD
jgi:hypothetical protein